MKQITDTLSAQVIGLDEAKERYGEYDYAIVHMLSDMQYGRTSDIKVCWDELVELRAFSEKGGLHIFGADGERKAVCVEETSGPEEASIIKYYPMRNGGRLAVKEYLVPDEDGQAVVRYTRPFAMM